MSITLLYNLKIRYLEFYNFIFYKVIEKILELSNKIHIQEHISKTKFGN